MFTKGDFHIHSTASDGELSPKEIIIAAKERGIDTIAITDHNTIAGVKEAIEAGKVYGVSVIPAVELSTRYFHQSVHLLGYFKNNQYNNTTFVEVLKLVKTHRIKNIKPILNNRTAIDRTAAEDSGRHLTIIEGMNLLRTFGAAVVLAHPVRINPKYLNDILNLPFDGIEARYCHSSAEDTLKFINIALSKFSFYTGGSDFHTNNRKDIKHSLIGEPCLNSSEIQKFLNSSGVLQFS